MESNPGISRVLQYPTGSLLSPSEEVGLEEARRIIAELREVSELIGEKIVAGLAAPQIGHNKRAFIARGEAYINPRILRPSSTVLRMRESCFSLYGQDSLYRVPRHKNFFMVWTSETGKEKASLFITERKYGSLGQVILHEFDHLEGKLCNGEPS